MSKNRIVILLAMLSSCVTTPTAPVTPPSPLPAGYLYGITLDSVDNPKVATQAIGKLPRKIATRIVFDENVPAKEYVDAVKEIGKVSFVMGELLDSYYVKDYSQARYVSRTRDYIDTFAQHGANVDIWEIGNEINGEWLGPGAIDKAAAAFDYVKSRGGKTALTLYYNPNCFEKPEHEMFRWTKANVPARMKTGLDYVLISYYEDDCENQVFAPSHWTHVFDQLGAIFPNSKLGLGEVGTTKPGAKEALIRRYYGMTLANPRFIGGYFYWYAATDMIPETKPLWRVLAEVLKK